MKNPMRCAAVSPVPRLVARSCAVVAAGLLAGCAQLPSGLVSDATEVLARPATQAPPLNLPPAARPSYRVGDTFVFGRTGMERVSRLARDTVEWTGPEGQTFLTRVDFFAPLLQHQRWGRDLSSTLRGDPSALWPLQVGRSVRFDELRSAPGLLPGASEPSTFSWTCEVEGTRLASVPAGDFPAFHVVCRSRRAGLPLVLQTARWDYAPSLGHFVRHTWNEGGRGQELVLSAALPGELASAKRLQRLLERLQTQP
jgi:hypothetical protein